MASTPSAAEINVNVVQIRTNLYHTSFYINKCGPVLTQMPFLYIAFCVLVTKEILYFYYYHCDCERGYCTA